MPHLLTKAQTGYMDLTLFEEMNCGNSEHRPKLKVGGEDEETKTFTAGLRGDRAVSMMTRSRRYHARR